MEGQEAGGAAPAQEGFKFQLNQCQRLYCLQVFDSREDLNCHLRLAGHGLPRDRLTWVDAGSRWPRRYSSVDAVEETEHGPEPEGEGTEMPPQAKKRTPRRDLAGCCRPRFRCLQDAEHELQRQRDKLEALSQRQAGIDQYLGPKATAQYAEATTALNSCTDMGLEPALRARVEAAKEQLQKLHKGLAEIEQERSVALDRMRWAEGGITRLKRLAEGHSGASEGESGPEGEEGAQDGTWPMNETVTDPSYTPEPQSPGPPPAPPPTPATPPQEPSPARSLSLQATPSPLRRPAPPGGVVSAPHRQPGRRRRPGRQPPHAVHAGTQAQAGSHVQQGAGQGAARAMEGDGGYSMSDDEQQPPATVALPSALPTPAPHVEGTGMPHIAPKQPPPSTVVFPYPGMYATVQSVPPQQAVGPQPGRGHHSGPSQQHAHQPGKEGGGGAGSRHHGHEQHQASTPAPVCMNCPLCGRDYWCKEGHHPYVLPACRHTMCHGCIKGATIDSGSGKAVRCPFERCGLMSLEPPAGKFFELNEQIKNAIYALREKRAERDRMRAIEAPQPTAHVHAAHSPISPVTPGAQQPPLSQPPPPSQPPPLSQPPALSQPPPPQPLLPAQPLPPVESSPAQPPAPADEPRQPPAGPAPAADCMPPAGQAEPQPPAPSQAQPAPANPTVQAATVGPAAVVCGLHGRAAGMVCGWHVQALCVLCLPVHGDCARDSLVDELSSAPTLLPAGRTALAQQLAALQKKADTCVGQVEAAASQALAKLQGKRVRKLSRLQGAYEGKCVEADGKEVQALQEIAGRVGKATGRLEGLLGALVEVQQQGATDVAGLLRLRQTVAQAVRTPRQFHHRRAHVHWPSDEEGDLGGHTPTMKAADTTAQKKRPKPPAQRGGKRTRRQGTGAAV